MLRWIDGFLNRVTMYRLAVYVLAAWIAAACAFALFGWLPFHPFALLFSTLFLTAACWITNAVFAKIFETPANTESFLITAFILALIITPPSSPFDAGFFSLAAWAAVWAMASKFILAVRGKHVFNPAAFAVALTALTLNQSASWWVGTAVMAPFVLAGGALLVRKIRRFDLVAGFFAAALAVIVTAGVWRGTALAAAARQVFFDTPLLFFGFVMLTEPLTTPPTRSMRLAYGALVGVLFAPWIRLGPIFSTPELALLVGNLFSYAVSPKQKLMLALKEKIAAADQVFDFVFRSDRPLAFQPGQYLEWTFAHPHPDRRGNRRYFTIASSPAEQDIRIGVKFYPQGSTFKKNLLTMKVGDTLAASQLAGEFVLPKDPSQKLAFIAGGIGVTPFRSMVQDLLDRRERRDIVLFYANTSEADVAYQDVFDRAIADLDLRIVYVTGSRLDAKRIAEEAPDFRERFFYLSGPHAMVTAFNDVLQTMGVPRRRIKKDFFPGFA